MNTALIVAAAAIAAMSAPVLAQEHDMSRGLPEHDMSRAGPSTGVYSAMITPPGAVPPLFYSGSTPAGPFATITTHSGKTTVTITTGPGGRMTTCFTSWGADGQPIVNCL